MEAFFGCIGAVIGLGLLTLPMIGFFISMSNRKRLANLQELQHANDVRTGVMSRELASLRAEIAALRGTGPAPEHATPFTASAQPEAGATAPRPATPTHPQPQPAPEPLPQPSPEPMPTPEPVPPPPEPEKPQEPIVVPPHEPSQPITEPSPEPVATEAPLETPPQIPVMPPPPPPPPRRPLAALSNFDWESLIGVKLFSWIAGVALALAALYLFKIAVDADVFTPLRRAIAGVITGIVLLVVCELRVAQRRYKVTANAMDGAGIAILYSTAFACHSLWHLLPSPAVFAFMILITVVAVGLSIRRESIFIALLGLFGGFLTPFMLSTGQDRPFGLFGYLLLLNAGLAWVAYRKRWPLLTGLSLLFTTIYQWSWVAKFLNADKLPTAVGIFLVFGIFTTVALLLGSRRDGEKSKTFETIALLGAGLPLLFAVSMAAVPAYGAHYAIFFGFLLVLDLGLLAIAIGLGGEATHLHGFSALATLIAVATWCSTSYIHAAWPAVLAWIAALVVLYAFGDSAAKRFGRELGGFAKAACYAAPVMLFVFPFLASAEPATASPAILFGALFVLLAALAYAALRTTRGLLYYIAAFFAVATEATWSAKYLNADRLIPALMIYGAFALFFLGVPAIARKMKVWMKPEGAGSVLLLASLALLLFLAAGPVASMALWGIALLLAVINAGVFFESSTSRHPVVSITGIVLSWAIIAIWWSTATITQQLVPAMAVVAGFALLVTAGNLWSRARTAEGTSESFGNSLFLALIGHLFLLFVAAQPALALPPWPIFAVLGVIDLGIAVAALYAKRGDLHVASLVSSMIVLLTWELTVDKGIWPTYAIVGSLILGAFAIVLIPLARRIGGDGLARTFSKGAITALFLSQFVTIGSSQGEGAPAFWLMVFAYAAPTIAVLWLALENGWLKVAPVAVVPVALGLAFWVVADTPTGGWGYELTFAAIALAIFLLFPILAARRFPRAIEPSVALALATAVVFSFERVSLLSAHFESIIGILPVALAALVCGVLVFFLRLEPTGERQSGRLALLAGTALAFITVAIPLQLEKQWITIGWALEAAALAWLFGKIRHRGLLYTSAGLAAAVFVRLVFNLAVFEYHPRGDVRILNWYLYTYLVSAAAFFAGALLLRNLEDRIMKVRLSKGLTSAGAVLLFLLLNIEIADFYSTGTHLTFNFSASLGQDLTYTLGWGVFAIGLLIAGLIWHTRTARVTSILLLLVTIGKCFIHDLGRLGGLYRVGSLVGLAISVAVVALLIQRFVMHPETEPPKEAAAP